MPVHMITTLLFDLPADLSRKIEGPLLAGYMITVGDFQSDCRQCNPIKSSKVNETVKSTAPCQRFGLMLL